MKVRGSLKLLQFILNLCFFRHEFEKIITEFSFFGELIL